MTVITRPTIKIAQAGSEAARCRFFHGRAAGMQDYSITKCTRKCAVSGRALEPDENYFSVIMPAGDEISRVDIAASQWTGPSAEAIGWWRSKMPAAAAKRMRPAPNGVLLDILSDLLQRPGQESLAYVLALLLVRRRVLHEEQSFLDNSDEAMISADENADESTAVRLWKLVCSADGREWHVPMVSPAGAQCAAVQAELKELLFTDE